jgi:hypothetical protein
MSKETESVSQFASRFFVETLKRGDRKALASKAAVLLAVMAMFLAVIHTMMSWNDMPGVTDNICYLRQAHLFSRFGIAGIDTDLRRDTDGWLSHPSRSYGFGCHHFIPATGKTVMQYPPGPGFLLSLFPEGFRTASLYMASTAIVFLLVCVSVVFARTIPSTLLSGSVGLVTLYFMVNPTRGSDSLAPTMPLACLCGLLTAVMFRLGSRVLMLVVGGLLGFLLGCAVDMRIANLLLAAGYFVYFGLMVLKRRQPIDLLQGCIFGASLIIGTIPTLVANYVNVGSPFLSAYTGIDTALPDFGISQIAHSMLLYAQGNNQSVMLAMALALTIGFRKLCGGLQAAGRIQFIIATNLLANMAFYLTHSGYNSYYAMGIATLTVWTAVFSFMQVPKLMPATS